MHGNGTGQQSRLRGQPCMAGNKQTHAQSSKCQLAHHIHQQDTGQATRWTEKQLEWHGTCTTTHIGGTQSCFPQVRVGLEHGSVAQAGATRAGVGGPARAVQAVGRRRRSNKRVPQTGHTHDRRQVYAMHCAHRCWRRRR